MHSDGACWEIVRLFYEGTSIPRAYVCGIRTGESTETLAGPLLGSEYQLKASREWVDRFVFNDLLVVASKQKRLHTYRSLARY